MPDPQPGQHIAAARRRLSHLAGLDVATEQAERKILAAAEQRLETVDGDLAQARRAAGYSDAARDRYLALTEERGRLLTVIERSRTALADPAPPDLAG